MRRLRAAPLVPLPLPLPNLVPAAASSCSRCQWPANPGLKHFQGSVRGFARRRTRLDEYNSYDAPFRLAEWRKANHDDGGFYPYAFEEMTPSEIATTIRLGAKTFVESPDFWRRAALAFADVGTALTTKQLASCCHAFGAVQWCDHAMVNAISSSIASKAPEMRAGDLTVVIQSFARMSAYHDPTLRVLSRTAQANQRMSSKGFAMVVESFSNLRFQDDGFLGRLDRWAAEGGVASCQPEESVVIAHSLSLFEIRPDGPGNGIVSAVSDMVGAVARQLETPIFHTALLALARLEIDCAHTFETFLEVLSEDLHRVQVKNIPPILDAITKLCRICFGDDALTAGGPEAAKRRKLVSRLTSRITRQLWQIRPQEASRAMQSVERAGLLDLYLIREATEVIPAQLAARPPEETLRLLAAYAAAKNPDTFMVPCIRRGLLPAVVHQGADLNDCGPISTAAILHFDDNAMVRFMSAFAGLKYGEGVLAISLALEGARAAESNASARARDASAGRVLTPSCQLALASYAMEALPTGESWKEAGSKLWSSEPALGNGSRWPVEVVDTVGAIMKDRAKPTSIEPDDLLLAVCAFPDHPLRPDWVNQLVSTVSGCNVALLPGLLMHPVTPALANAAEIQLATKLVDGAAVDLPISTAVAAARILAARYKVGSERRSEIQECIALLAARVVHLAERDLEQVPVKAVVRTFQCLRAVSLSPPTGLIQTFAETAHELTPTELIVALKLLPNAKAVRSAKCDSVLSSVVMRAAGQFRSAKQAWELDGLCKSLGLKIEEAEHAVAVGSDDEEEAHGRTAPR